jgi:hypothetical protein
VQYANVILHHPADSKYYQDNLLFQNLQQADRYRLTYLLRFAKSAMTPGQFTNAIDGFSAAHAAGGKRMLKKMDDSLKLWLIDCGAHVAYQGAITPDQAWRFDKTLTPKLAKDGSNFFDLAERVR